MVELRRKISVKHKNKNLKFRKLCNLSSQYYEPDTVQLSAMY